MEWFAKLSTTKKGLAIMLAGIVLWAVARIFDIAVIAIVLGWGSTICYFIGTALVIVGVFKYLLNITKK